MRGETFLGLTLKQLLLANSIDDNTLRQRAAAILKANEKRDVTTIIILQKLKSSSV